MKQNRSKYWIAIIAVLFSAPFAIDQAWAQDVGNCLDLGTCASDNGIFGLSMIPYTLILGPFIYIIFWGLAIFMIQLLAHMPMLTSMVGVIIALGIAGADVYTDALSSQALYYGYILIGVSVGLALFTMFKQRVVTG